MTARTSMTPGRYRLVERRVCLPGGSERGMVANEPPLINSPPAPGKAGQRGEPPDHQPPKVHAGMVAARAARVGRAGCSWPHNDAQRCRLLRQ